MQNTKIPLNPGVQLSFSIRFYQIYAKFYIYFQPSVFTLKSRVHTIPSGTSRDGLIISKKSKLLILRYRCTKSSLLCSEPAVKNGSVPWYRMEHITKDIYLGASDRVQDREQRRHEVQFGAKGLDHHPLLSRINLWPSPPPDHWKVFWGGFASSLNNAYFWILLCNVRSCSAGVL